MTVKSLCTSNCITCGERKEDGAAPRQRVEEHLQARAQGFARALSTPADTRYAPRPQHQEGCPPVRL